MNHNLFPTETYFLSVHIEMQTFHYVITNNGYTLWFCGTISCNAHIYYLNRNKRICVVCNFFHTILIIQPNSITLMLSTIHHDCFDTKLFPFTPFTNNMKSFCFTMTRFLLKYRLYVNYHVSGVNWNFS